MVFEQLKEKVVVITGATSGLGKALAQEFGRAGSMVYVTGRDPKKLQNYMAELRRELSTDKIGSYHMDVTSLTQVSEGSVKNKSIQKNPTTRSGQVH